ncbi:MAG: peptidylprolyl isomerase [Bacteroidales bacterium]
MDKTLLKKTYSSTCIKYLLFSAIFFYLTIGLSFSQIKDDVLLTVQDRQITITEFLRLWEKSDHFRDSLDIDEYMELFIDFQLKVAHAREEGIQTEPAIRNEIARYRRDLASKYMGDPETEEYLVREAYERLQYDIDASHILVRLIPGYSPEDTLMAWEKAMQIRELLLEGESFEKIARATSDDPSAKTNSGNLGYFTVLQMAYPFENAVYNTELEEISLPVRTRFGYHIIRVNDVRKSRGEIKTAHILFGFDSYNESEAEKIARDTYQDILSGQSFEALAKELSTDFITSSDGGVLPWFGAGKYPPEFESAAFSLNKSGEISEPVRTPYGWHIIKLIDQRGLPSYDRIKEQLLDRIRKPGNNRSGLIKKALVERLKTEWRFSENTQALDIFPRLVDDSIFDGKWTAPANLPLNGILFSVTDKTVTQRDFAEFISNNVYRRKPWPLDEYINRLYEEFVDNWLIELENDNLEIKYPEFRYNLNEYSDGILLYEITAREIWTNAATDSAGLAEFYEANRNNYMWGTRIEASIYTTDDGSLTRRIARRARRSTFFLFPGRDDNWVVERINQSEEPGAVTYERGIYGRRDSEITDTIDWEEGVSGTYRINDQYKIVLVHDVMEPEPMTLEEAEKAVIADYRDYLEEKWIENLREKYNVVVNTDVLSGID